MVIYSLIALCIKPVLLIATLGLLLLTSMLLIECVAAVLPVPARSWNKPAWTDIKVAVLVPAHDEAAVIETTLVPVRSQLKPNDRLIVIADNCNDNTAEIASTAGAIVLERQDEARRGKGYALDFGLQYLDADPPAVVVTIDADCIVEPGTIERLAQQAIATQRPVQSTYLMTKPDRPSAKDSVSAFSVKLQNLVRPRGLSRLGMPCMLTGSGIAFPWRVIRLVNLASGHIAEDKKLGFDLAIAGYSPTFTTEARVIGHLPQQEQGAKSQRTRWEHGHLQLIREYTPKLLAAAFQQRRFDLLITTLDLCVLPMSLLVLGWLAVMAISLLAGGVGLSWIPAWIAATAGTCLVIAISASWARFGRADLPLAQLLSIPLYIVWMIPIYLKFLVNPQSNWVRTDRTTREMKP